MTVAELIAQLQEIEEKHMEVYFLGEITPIECVTRQEDDQFGESIVLV